MNYYSYLKKIHTITMDGESDVPVEKCRAQGGPSSCSVHGPMLRTELAREDSETPSKVSPEEDAAYVDAVKRGDMAEAMRMVRDAAARSMPNTKVVGEDGKPMVVYHGTSDARFYEFFESDSGIFFSSKDRASWYVKGEDRPKTWRQTRPFYDWDEVRKFADKNEIDFYKDGSEGAYVLNGKEVSNLLEATDVAEDYGRDSNGGMIPCFLNLENPRIVDGKGRWAGNVNQRPDRKSQDGVVVENVTDGTFAGGDDFEDTNYVVLSSSQIKLADITYDDERNLIPLSKRFDMTNPDIRY